VSVRQSRLSATLAAWRIARRDAMRHKGRSILVMVMIGLPVAGVVFTDVVWRTSDLSPSQRADQLLGTEADAYVQLAFPDVTNITQAVDPARDGWQAAEVPNTGNDTATLPRSWTTVSREVVGFARFLSADEDRVAPAELLEFRYADPLVAGLVRQLAGRPPAGQNEVVLTQSLAERLDLGVGDTLVPSERSPSFEIVGVTELPADLNYEAVIADPGTLSALGAGPGDRVDSASIPLLYVDAGGPVTWDEVRELNESGYLVTSRAVLLDPPACGGTDGPLCPESALGGEAAARAFALIALLVVMALLQVVLLAGPAFAIGRRAQARDLALVAASGGDRRHVGGIVRGGGLALGGVGGVAGAAVAIIAVIAFKPQLSRLGGSALPSIDVQPLDIIAILAVAIVTGLVAAWLPARQASRQDVVAALGGRRPAPRLPKRIPALGAAAVVVGALIAFYGAGPGDPLAIVFGSVVAELGLVAMSPTLVAWVARIGPRLPAVPRLALRDAARSRTRSGPAVAAVMAAVAGAVAVSIFATSQEAAERRGYLPTLPQGMVGVSILFTGADQDDLEQVVATVERELPVEQTYPIEGIVLNEGVCEAVGCDALMPFTPEENVCPLDRARGVDKAQAAAAAEDWRCQGREPYASLFGEWLVGDAATLAALTGVDDPDARRALESNGTVMFDRAYVLDGVTTLQVVRLSDDGTTSKVVTQTPDGELGRLEAQRSVELPAVWLADGVQPALGFLSPVAAAALDLPVEPTGALFETSRVPTRDEQDTAQRAVELAATAGTAPYLVVERGYQVDTTVALLVLSAISGVVALAATAIAVGLAGADGKPDLATLAAIGAAPRTRRLLAASQALVIAGLGAALGVIAGLVPGIAAVRTQTDWTENFVGVGDPPTLPVVIPWGNLALLLVVVPLLAMVCAALFSRSRLPMVRRLN
jgi:putative ABC transport system permease protein